MTSQQKTKLERVRAACQRVEPLIRERLRYDPETGIIRWARRYTSKTRSNLVAGCLTDIGYIRTRVGGVNLFAHRIAWFIYYGSWPTGELDHINKHRSDNRISNLREAGTLGNAHNKKMPSNNSSGVKGVSWVRKRKKWYARVICGGRPVLNKNFNHLEDAERAVMEARTQWHREFASHV